MLKLRDLRAVVTVASTGSVSRAAEKLNLSQPAVTHAVRRVEEELGFELFDRTNSGMTPTAVGVIVARRAAKALQYLIFDEEELVRSPAFKRVQPSALATFEKTVSRSQLRTLVEVANCRGIGCTAQRIGVSKTVIYRQLRQMEDIIGAEIFRRGDTFSITPLGEALLRRANLIFAELRSLYGEVGQFMGRVEGQLVVGTLPSARTILVPRTIAELSRTHPDIHITMVDKPYDEMVTELSCGKIDIIVGSIRRPPPDSNMSEFVLFRDPIAVLARAGHPILDKPDVTLADLAECKWTMPRLGVPSRDYFEGLFSRHGFARPRNIVETDSLIALRSLLVEDDRLTITSPYRASLEIELGLLRIVPFKLDEFSLLFGYLIRSQDILPPCLDAFVRTFQNLGSGEIQRRAVKSGLSATPVPTSLVPSSLARDSVTGVRTEFHRL